MAWLLALGVSSLVYLKGAHAFGAISLLSGHPTTCHPTSSDVRTTSYHPWRGGRERATSHGRLQGSDFSRSCYSSVGGVRSGNDRVRRSVRLSMEAGGANDEEEGTRSVQTRGLLRRIVKRVVTTGKKVGQQAGDRIRGGADSDDDAVNDTPRYPETPELKDASRLSIAAAPARPAAMPQDSQAATSSATAAVAAAAAAAAATTPPRSNATASSRDAERPGFATRRSLQGFSKGAGRKVDVRAGGGGEMWSPLDMAVRPLQAFAGVIQKQAEALEGELSRRVSGAEAGFNNERAAMKETLAGERLASKAKLEEAEQQLVRLREVAAEKQKADEMTKKISAEAEQATAVYNASAMKLQAEAASVRKQLEKEKAAVAAAQAEAGSVRAAQEKERAAAQAQQKTLNEELERERQASKKKETTLSSELSSKNSENARAVKVANERTEAAWRERARSDGARAEAEARAVAAEAAAAATSADLAAAKGRAEREVAMARAEAAAAAIQAAEAKSSSGIDELKAELARTTSQLNIQTKRAVVLEGAKKRAETESIRRSRGLQELMERNRSRYEKATAELKEEVKELGLLQSAAAGFEEVKIKLGMAQNKSSDLEREVSNLNKKVENLDQKLALGAQSSAQEKALLAKKEAALREADAQLQAVRERSTRLEKDSKRASELQVQLEEASEEGERERQRADDLQAERDQAESKSDLVKDRLFDLERSVEMAEWSGRKLTRENEGLQGLISRNRKRFQRELGKLTEASADLADKTVALQELETVLDRERESAKQLGGQVNDLKERSAALASELNVTRDKLAKETERRMRAETAVRQATDKSYVEKLQLADVSLKQAQREGEEAVAEVRAVLAKEKAGWDEERTSLTTRLEEALRSSKEFSTRMADLEGVAEQLRRESEQANEQVAVLREKLQLVTASAQEATEEQKRLRGELDQTADALEDRTRLQQSVASLKAALKKATGGAKDNTPDARSAPAIPASPQQSGSSSSSSSSNVASEKASNPGDARPATPDASGKIEATTMPAARDARGAEVVDGAVAAGGGAAGGGSGQPGWVAPTPDILLAARESLSAAAALFSGTSVKTNEERYQLLNEADARENAEAVSAIDDFLERSQDGVGPEPTSTPISEDAGNGTATGATTDADSESGDGGQARDGDGAQLKPRTGWVGSSRWSRNKQA